MWDHLIEGYYKKDDRIDMTCTGCAEESRWCNCSIRDIKQEQNYSIAIKIEETLRTKGVKGASTTRVTNCPITGQNTDVFYCNWPDQTSKIPARLLCNGHPDNHT